MNNSPITEMDTQMELPSPEDYFRRLSGLLPEELQYYVVAMPSGERSFFSTKSEATAAAAKVGGTVVAVPDRSALRLLGLSAGVTAVPVNPQVTVSADGNVIHLGTDYISITAIREQADWRFLAVTAVAVGGRVVPGVGAASTDERRMAKVTPGLAWSRAAMIAATRALNRSIQDALAATVTGIHRPQPMVPPHIAVVRYATALGLPLGSLVSIIGKPVAQVTEEELEDVLAKIKAAVEQGV